MRTARIRSLVYILLAATISVTLNPKGVLASAGSSNICSPSSSCTIGEYLFDDDYNALTGATCTVDINYPDDSVLVSGQSLSGQADGWYSYDFTAPSTTGYYRSVVCCTSGSEYLCIDKDFEVSAASGGPSSSDIADAVWGYSSRTMTGFGSLISDIWNGATRTLTGSGLSDGNSIATQSDVTDIRNKTTNITNYVNDITSTINSNNTLLEKLANKPIIEFVVEEDEEDVSTKLEDSKTKVHDLYAKTMLLESKTEDLRVKWYNTSELGMLESLSELATLIGNGENEESLYSGVSWFSNNWDWDVNNQAKAQTRMVRSNLLLLSAQLEREGKTYSTRVRLVNILSGIDKLKDYIGNPKDSAKKTSLFGSLYRAEQKISKIDSYIADIDKFLESWSGTVDLATISTIKKFAGVVKTFNTIPDTSKFLLVDVSTTSSSKNVKNKSLAIRGIASSNIRYIAARPNQNVKATWLEEGSIIFKTLVTNPSQKITQDAEIKYYLPMELTQEDILNIDPGLEYKYDIEKDQYYIEGIVTIDPGKTESFSVRTEDVWKITEEEITKLSSVAEEILAPLEGTSFFAQGVTLKSAIDADVAGALSIYDKGVTPEQKIKNARDAAVFLASAGEKLEKMNELLVEASSVGTLFGFIGGTQAIAVWGLILIIATGFIFMAVSLKKISEGKKVKKINTKPLEDKSVKEKSKTPKVPLQKKSIKFTYSVIGFLIVGSGVVSSVITYKAVSRYNIPVEFTEHKEETDKSEDKSTEVKNEDDAGDDVLSANDDRAIGGAKFVLVDVPVGSSVIMRKLPSMDSLKIHTFAKAVEVIKIEAEDEWVNVAAVTDDGSGYLEGWVHSDYIYEVPIDGDNFSIFDDNIDPGEIGSKVTVLSSFTGGLRVRTAPVEGAVVGKVYSGETYSVVDESFGWYEIKLLNGTTGWVSGDFVEVDASF